jgi:uncharacterized protein (TIGR00661 family)
MKSSPIKKLKILYAFQGTGNGHASRAAELVPLLKERAEVDVLCSGLNSQLKLPFPIDIQRFGLSFNYNKSGGLSYWNTLISAHLNRFYRECSQLDLSAYDLVLNDFEPVSAYAAQRQGVEIIGLSHQAAFLSDKTPRIAKRNIIAEWVFKHYAPVKKAIGFHFDCYDSFVKYPVIRQEIETLKISDNGHYLVYLPAYSEDILKNVLGQVSSKQWIIFSKTCEKEYVHLNLHFKPISGRQFLTQLAACEGLLCSAGFEAPAEALYLGKKLFVVPIKGQYEQACNGEALRRKGVYVWPEMEHKTVPELIKWVSEPQSLKPQKISKPAELLDELLKSHTL